MATPPVARATFNMKFVWVTVLFLILCLAVYIFAANFWYQEGVKAEESATDSGESPIERKVYPKGFDDGSRPQEQQQEYRPTERQQAQQQQNGNGGGRPPPQRKDPRPMNFGIGEIDKQDEAPAPARASPAAMRGEAQNLPPYAQQGLSDNKRAFARNAGGGKAYVDATLQEPMTDMMIRRSRIIPVVSVNAPSTGQPGDMFAMVTEDVRDSLTGKCVLIPAASIVSGEVNDVVEYGAETGQGAWTGMSLPTGQWVEFPESMPATNSQGRAGLYGTVNRHRGSFALALLTSATLQMLSNAGQLMGSGGEVTVYGAGGNAAANAVSDPMSEWVSRELNRENTIDMEIGETGAFLVKRDLYLPPQGDCDA